MEKEIVQRLLERLETSTTCLSWIAEKVITKDNFTEQYDSLQRTIKDNKAVIDEVKTSDC